MSYGWAGDYGLLAVAIGATRYVAKYPGLVYV